MPSLKGPIVGLIVAPILTWLTWSTAVDLQNGIHPQYTGRRTIVKRLLASIAESLGPTGVLLVGGAVCLGMAAWLVMTLKRRKAEKA